VKQSSLEYWLPVVLWLTVLYVFSTDAFSGSETSRIIGPALRFLFPGMSDADLAFWHGVIRKLSHVGAYFILAVLTYRSLRHERPDPAPATVLTAVFVLIAALTDEFHQSLTSTRGASLFDVGYDCLGGVWALWLITIYESRRLRSHSVL
jgi:VanZ family protein